MTVRAVRNNNPCNLEAGTAWQGLMPRSQMDADQLAETRFAVFQNAKYGFRATGIVLLNYEKLHGLHTIRQFINRFAPPGENNTDAYTTTVAQACGADPDKPYELRTAELLERIVKAMSTHEAGGWFFSYDDLHQGIAMSEAA